VSTLKVFKESLMVRLKSRSEIKKNLDNYTSDYSWITTYTYNSKICLETNFKLPENFILNKDSEDIDNSIITFNALKDLSRTQAADPRLWTYLTHVKFWEYMRARWPLERSTAGDKVNYIRERYFVSSNNSRSLIRNGIGRLWWYSYLTYDKTRSDPFELTKILLSQQDIAAQITERSFSRNRKLIFPILDFIRVNPRINELNIPSRTVIRKLLISLNFKGGVCLLDNLSHKEVMDYLASILRKIEVECMNQVVEVKRNRVRKPIHITAKVDEQSIASPAEPLVEVRLSLISRRGIVEEKSGLNLWNANGRKRDVNEVYLPLPLSSIPLFENIFDTIQRGLEFIAITHDKHEMRMKFKGSVKKNQMIPKQIASTPSESEFGDWILRRILNLEEGELVTVDILEKYGRTDISFSRLGTRNGLPIVYCDFSVD